MKSECKKLLPIFAILLLLVAAPTGVMAQENTTKTPDTPSGDQPDTEDTESEDSSSEDSGDREDSNGNSSDEDSGDSESNLREENREIVENNNPDFRLPDSVDVYEHKVTNSETVFIVHNTGDDIAQVMAANDGAGSKRIEKDFELGPDEATRVVLPSTDMIETGASVSVYLSFDEREELDDGDITTYIVDTIAWAPNHAPDIAHPIFGVFIGIGTVVLVTFARRKIDNRVTKLAVRLDGILNKPRIIRSVNYVNIPDDAEGWERARLAIKERFKAFAPAMVAGAFWLWGLSYFFGVSLAGTYYIPLLTYFVDIPFLILPRWLEPYTVYMMYGITASYFVSNTILAYLEFKDRVVIKDSDPETGDHATYYLNQARFAAMDVYCKTKDGRAPVDKDWLHEINPESAYDSYECVNYDMYENECEVSWSGMVQQIRPSQLRAERSNIRQLKDELQLAEEKVRTYNKNYIPDVVDMSEYVSAQQTAVLEGTAIEDLETAREKMEKRMEKKGHSEMVDGDKGYSISDELDGDYVERDYLPDAEEVADKVAEQIESKSGGAQ